MTLSWLPVIWVDMLGSAVTLVLAFFCAVRSWRWTKTRSEDSFRYYVFLLTLFLGFFAISRSFGHLVKQTLLFYEMEHIWKQIAPFSGTINTVTFVTIFAFGIYFHRSRKVYLELELHKNNLEKLVEERTAELEEKNILLKGEINERERAETSLAEEKEQLAVTLRSIGDGVITTDTLGNIVLINRIAEDLTGWNQGEAVGRPLREVFNIINEQTREPCEDPVTKVIASGEIIDLANHTVLIAKNGTERSIADSAAPIMDMKSRIIGIVLVFRDVTEKLRTEEELLKIEKLESVGVLAGGLAHDFNNILAAILGNINLAGLLVNPEEKVHRLLAEAEQAILRAKDLTQQLLTFSKGGEPVKEAISIQEIIKASADFVLHGAKVACEYHMPEDLWLVEIDKGQIGQVIQNLIINASHAMPEGGVIKITCENIDTIANKGMVLPRKDNYIKITISDSGVGIPENVIDKIFDPYFTTKQEGSGLGLAIIHSIISKHDGHISVQSKSGVGTTFTIYLPATFKQQQIEEAKTLELLKGGIKVLVMDDEEMVRTTAENMLAHVGCEVILAKDGTEAVELYKELNDSPEPVDVVIMDLTIPAGMGGKEAVQKIRAIKPEAKVIVSSGYSNDPIMANYQEYGFSAAIIKPYELHELIKGINKALL